MIHLRGTKGLASVGQGGGANPFPASTPLPFSVNTGGAMGEPDADDSGRGGLAMDSGKRKRPGSKKRTVSPPVSKAPKFADSMGAGSKSGEDSKMFSGGSKRSFPQKRY